MKTSSEPVFNKYADLDFFDAKAVSAVPALAQLQAKQGGKARITMRVDNATLSAFKLRAQASGDNYQTLMNQALHQLVQGHTLADVVRETIRKEMQSAQVGRIH